MYTVECKQLSIPLYGFMCSVAWTKASRPLSPFNSIVWILTDYSYMARMLPDFQFHCMDSVVLHHHGHEDSGIFQFHCMDSSVWICGRPSGRTGRLSIPLYGFLKPVHAILVPPNLLSFNSIVWILTKEEIQFLRELCETFNSIVWIPHP